jgi:hypothetical protein
MNHPKKQRGHLSPLWFYDPFILNHL